MHSFPLQLVLNLFIPLQLVLNLIAACYQYLTEHNITITPRLPYQKVYKVNIKKIEIKIKIFLGMWL